MRLISTRPAWPLLLIAAALRLVHLHAPILGVHSWRQADTAAIARNAFEHQLPFWTPQVDWGGMGSGFAETDPPLYSQAVASLYGVFGVHEWLARGLSLVLSLIGLWLVLRLGRRLLGAEAGWWGALFFAVLQIGKFERVCKFELVGPIGDNLQQIDPLIHAACMPCTLNQMNLATRRSQEGQEPHRLDVALKQCVCRTGNG